MKTLKQDLGKVSVTCNGVWDAGRNYDRLCIVNDGNFASYISKKFAPEGILLSNEEYWQPIASLRDDIKIDYDKFKKEWIQMLAEIQLKLKASRIVVENDIERESLSWLQVAAGCEVYVKDTKLSWILESIVPVLNYKEWRLESDSKIDSVPTYELTGEFENLIADRTIADRWGHIIDEYYVTRDMVTNFIIETVRKYIHEAAILPGSIKPEDLSQAVLDLIGYGQITNLADEEDLTDYTNANGTHVLRFKDKVYNEADGSGLGRAYLRKNKVQGVNTLVQQMIDKPNTIYIVQYDYNLGEQTINLPENSILKFEGGTLCNGIIVGNNTQIDAEKEVIFKIGLNIQGTWNCPNIYDNWFEFNSVLGDKFISNDIINNILALSSDYVNNTIHFDADRTYYFENTYKGRTNLGDDVRPDYWKLHTEEYSFLRIFTGITSNTHLIFNNTLQMLPTNQGAYNIFFIENKENIQISGIGSINGDAKDHLYTNPFVAGSDYFGEWGHIFNVRSCNNVEFRDITLKYAFGDCISFSTANYNNNGVLVAGVSTSNVIVDNVKIIYARRNGISLGGKNYSINNVYFEGCGSDEIKGTAPKCGIDFENDQTSIEPTAVCQNVVMTACKFTDNKFDISSTIRFDLGNVPSGELVTINDCNFTAPLRLNLTRGLTFNTCHIKGITSHDNSIAAWYSSEDLIFNNCVFDELNPYLPVSAEEQNKKFINPTYPENVKYTTTFQANLAAGKGLRFTIAKPLVGEVELTALCSNSNYSNRQMPINTTLYSFGGNQNTSGIRDVKLRTPFDSTPRYSMYRYTPVFSNIVYSQDANNFYIYFAIGGDLINTSIGGTTSINIFLTSKTKIVVIKEPVSEREGYAGMYGGEWSKLSSIKKEVINVSDIPSTVTFPNKELYATSEYANLPTSLLPTKAGDSIFVSDNGYKRPVFWDSFNNTFRTADGNRALTLRVTNTPELQELTSKLTINDRGYKVYNIMNLTYLTWNGYNWMNEDGTSFDKVRYIKASNDITAANTLFSYSGIIYKIVGNIDLDGGELTIASGSTLDFQGGSFSNGTIVGRNTKISGNTIGIFDESVTISGIWNIERISSKFFKTLNNDNSLRNVINLSNSSICNEIIIEEGVYYFNFETNYEAGLTINSNTSLIINGSLNVKPNRFPNYYVIKCNEVENITIKGNGSIIGDKDGHLYDEWEYESTHEWGHGVGVTKSNNILIHGLNISKCTGDGISITGEKNIIEYCNIFDCRRQGISFTKGKDLIIRNCEIYDIYVNDGTPPGAAIDIEPNSSGVVNGCSKVIIENCNFYNCNYGILIYSVSYYLDDFYLRNNIIDNVLNSCIALDASATTKGYPITNVFIEGNKLSNANYKSLFIASCENLIVQNNTIIEKTGATAYPIEIRNTTLCNISDNIINSSNLWNIYKCNININNNIFNNTNIENSSGYIPIKTINIVKTVPSGSSFIELNDVPIIFFGNTFNNYIINSKLNCHIKSNIINIDCVHTYHDWNVANFIVEDNDYNLINNVYVNSPFFSISGSCVAIFNNNRFTVINNAVNRIIYSTVGNSVSLNGNVFKGNTSANYNLTYPYILNYKTIYANYVYKGSSSGKPNLTEKDFGFIYLDQTINRPIYWNGVNWIDFEGGSAFYKIRGTTENRPTLMAENKGYQYYDTTLNKWINWTGTAWTNLDGTALA